MDTESTPDPAPSNETAPDTAELYRRAADGFERALAGVQDWGARTPCEDWDARELAAHVVHVSRMMLARVDGSTPEEVPADADVPAAWREVRAALEQAIATSADAEVDFFGGPARFRQIVETVLCADTALHTWDLARATGQAESLDPELVARAHAFLASREDMLRSPGGFGPAVAVPDDASAQDRLLAFAGRDPRPR